MVDRFWGKAFFEQPHPRVLAHHFLSARTYGHPFRFYTDHVAGMFRGADGNAEQRVELLRSSRRHRRKLLHWKDRPDARFSAMRALALHNLARHLLG
jgi:hypothetical protein